MLTFQTTLCRTLSDRVEGWFSLCQAPSPQFLWNSAAASWSGTKLSTCRLYSPSYPPLIHLTIAVSLWKLACGRYSKSMWQCCSKSRWYRVNNTKENTIPCGTPVLLTTVCDVRSFSLMYWGHLSRSPELYPPSAEVSLSAKVSGCLRHYQRNQRTLFSLSPLSK